MKKTALAAILALTMAPAFAADYVIDTQGAHASIQFRVKHLGYSWLTGRFNHFSGTFSYDEKDPASTRVVVDIDPASIDSNHAERDKHLRSKDFLDVARYPQARFVATGYQEGGGRGQLQGELTLHGVTRPVVIDVEPIGAGDDPWGGYRRGFTGTTLLTLKDYGIDFDLGPAARQVELFLAVEGIRQ